jgi:hypothetical protein
MIPTIRRDPIAVLRQHAAGDGVEISRREILDAETKM